jgi:LmbE family N-acetylglucosaminyl deacetylase
MLSVGLGKRADEPIQVLLLGAHGDDIEIGCGGTLLELLHQYRRLSVHWVVLTADAERATESTAAAERFLEGAAARRIVIERFRDGYLPYQGDRVKDFFEALKGQVAPDVVFTHHRADGHQDHRLVCELTWNTFRDHLILEYEVPKYDADLGSPNVFVHVDEARAQLKARWLMESYRSQWSRPWFSIDAFLAIMRLRGIEARATRYAEAFYCRKLVVAGPPSGGRLEGTHPDLRHLRGPGQGE